MASLVPDESGGHDFGPVLANDQVLHHDFRIKNISNRSVRLERAVAHSPCCSAVGPIPEVIPPGESAKLPTSFRPGTQVGKRMVAFSVFIDDPAADPIPLTLVADLISAWEVCSTEQSLTSFPLASQGVLTLDVTARRNGREGLDFPVKVETSSEIEAAFDEGVVKANEGKGLVSTSRRLRIRIPPAITQGMHQAELEFLWDDGSRRRQLVQWEVRPSIRAYPSALVMTAPDLGKEIVIRLQSESLPFRVLGVQGASLLQKTDASAKASLSHDCRVRLPDHLGDGQGVFDIGFSTDHPRQKIVPVTVVVSAPRSTQQ